MEISEKLLNIVLEKELEKKYDGSYIFICNGIINLENNEVSSTLGFYDSEIDFFINIYELAHKCKEWAFKQGYLIGCNCRLGITITNIDTHDNIKWFEVNFDEFIEYEIKACQWILDNKAL